MLFFTITFSNDDELVILQTNNNAIPAIMERRVVTLDPCRMVGSLHHCRDIQNCCVSLSSRIRLPRGMMRSHVPSASAMHSMAGTMAGFLLTADRTRWIQYCTKDEGQLTTDVEGNMRSTVEHYMAGLLLTLALGVDSYEGRRATYDRCIIYRITISFFRTKK